MPTSDFDHVEMLAGSSWPRCEALLRAFEQAWSRGEAPSVADFLRADGPERRALLVELIHVDLEFRIKRGERVRVESYLAAHPELAADRWATLELVAAEFELCRRQRGAVSPDEYRDRFPDLRDELFDRLRISQGDT